MAFKCFLSFSTPFSLYLILTAIVIGGVNSEYIEYNTTPRIVPEKINVHLVPHSHDDVGWLKTVDQYYVGANNSIRGACVQNVLDSVIASLLDDENRKFIYVEMAFFERWWRQQSKAMKVKVKKLVDSGQLEFINGGMCMHDEATPHYIDMIDQTTLGHQFIKTEFGQVPRVGWQIDPFGHSAVQAYLLGAELGFDSLFFARIDYQDRAKRLREKTLEVIWQGSKSLGSSSQIFTGVFPRHYDPPDGFTFEINDVSAPIQDDPLLFDYNVQERVNDFVAAALSQVNVTRTNHIMWLMGTDFRNVPETGDSSETAWGRFHDVSGLALRLLGQPSSSSCCERNWSTYSFIHSLRRNRLAPSRAQDLVFIHNNLRLLSRNSNQYQDEKTSR